jgi:hypothetical protein
MTVAGSTVCGALEAVFADNPKLRGYILDDQGQLRKHVLIAVDGDIIADRINLSDPVAENTEVYVMQAQLKTGIFFAPNARHVR